MGTTLQADEAYYITQKDGYFIDLRDPYQYKQKHIKNFQNIPYDIFMSQIGSLKKDKPYYLICQYGGHSRQCADILRSQGFEVYDFAGGMQPLLYQPPSSFF